MTPDWSVIAVLAFTVLAGFLFVVTLYLQQVRGTTSARAQQTARAVSAGHPRERLAPVIGLGGGAAIPYAAVAGVARIPGIADQGEADAQPVHA